MIWLLIYKKNVYLQTLNEETFSGCSVARSSRLVWDEEVAGSNPATPTKKPKSYDFGFSYFIKNVHGLYPFF